MLSDMTLAMGGVFPLAGSLTSRLFWENDGDDRKMEQSAEDYKVLLNYMFNTFSLVVSVNVRNSAVEYWAELLIAD